MAENELYSRLIQSFMPYFADQFLQVIVSLKVLHVKGKNLKLNYKFSVNANNF